MGDRAEERGRTETKPSRQDIMTQGAAAVYSSFCFIIAASYSVFCFANASPA
jgi:hypothetical protein